MLFGISTIDYKTSAIEANNGTVADWKFDENAADGNISDGSLIIIDQTENGNDLVMNVYDPNNTITDWSNYLEFSDESMDMTSGSMVFSGDNEHRTGADFITVDDAPINDETFESGFTLEFMYKLPANWTTKDAWMGLMARQADPEIIADSMDEEQLGSLSLAISSCKEL